MVASTVWTFLVPYAPRLVPLLVFACLFSFAALLSFVAGCVVWSSLSLGWTTPLYLQYGDYIPPYAHSVLPRLVPQQRYDIFVDLVVPYTESNLQLGNFMTSLTLATSGNKTLAQVRKASITLPPSSNLLFRRPTIQEIKLPMLTSFTPSISNLLATVEIGRRDGWKTLGEGHARELNIISASLRCVAVPRGIRGLALRFPLVSSALAAVIFMLILSTTIGLCVLPQIFPARQEGNPDLLVKIEKTPPAPRRSSSQSKFNRQRRSRSTSDLINPSDVKVEPSSLITPPAASTSTPFRRRTSRPKIATTDSP